MKNLKTNAKLPILLLVALISISFSCSDWDDFKESTEGGEIIYPGKVSYLDVQPGDGRVNIVGFLGPDPRVVSYRIYWNDFADSVEFSKEDLSFEHILDVEEGTRTFEIYTYDEDGNKSVPVVQIGTSYGANYRKKIINRLVSSIHATDSSTMLIWLPIDLTLGPQYTEVTYEVGAETFAVQTPVSEDTTELIGLTSNAMVSYHTTYLPEVDCIDLFDTETKEYSVQR